MAFLAPSRKQLHPVQTPCPVLRLISLPQTNCTLHCQGPESIPAPLIQVSNTSDLGFCAATACLTLWKARLPLRRFALRISPLVVSPTRLGLWSGLHHVLLVSVSGARCPVVEGGMIIMLHIMQHQRLSTLCFFAARLSKTEFAFQGCVESTTD